MDTKPLNGHIAHVWTHHDILYGHIRHLRILVIYNTLFCMDTEDMYGHQRMYGHTVLYGHNTCMDTP